MDVGDASPEAVAIYPVGCRGALVPFRINADRGHAIRSRLPGPDDPYIVA